MPYECSMCNKKFRQKQGLNAHVKANRCKVALRGITNSPGSTSSTNSERSNSPRTVPYPTANQNRAPGLSPNIKPKENVLSPAALLKLLSQPITVSNHSHPYHHTPTLSPTNQISLTPNVSRLANLQPRAISESRVVFTLSQKTRDRCYRSFELHGVDTGTTCGRARLQNK